MYGAEVVQILKENGDKAVLILSRENTNALFRNYSEFFEEEEQNGKKGIKLKAVTGIYESTISTSPKITSSYTD